MSDNNTTDLEATETDAADALPVTDDVPYDALMWCIAAMPAVAILAGEFFSATAMLGANIGVHVAAAQQDREKNPRLEELRFARLSLVLFSPVYFVRRQRLLGRPWWPMVGGWLLSYVVAFVAIWSLGWLDVPPPTAPEVEGVIIDVIEADLPPDITAQVSCVDAETGQASEFDCVLAFSDGSSVEVRATVDDSGLVRWGPLDDATNSQA